MKRPRSRSWPALAAALCVLSLLAGDLLRGVHLLREHHVVCLAHGELIEAPERTAEPPQAGEASEVVPAAPALEGHEHCAAAATQARPFALALAGAPLALLDDPRVPDPGTPGAEAPAGRAALEYAPKQGPPVPVRARA